MPVPTLTGFVRRLTVTQNSDDVLVREFVDTRSEAAFAELVRRYGPQVFAVCRRVLGDHHLAEDAFQAVFVVLARKAHTILPPGAVGGWLYGVARRAAAEAAAMRRRKERETLPGILPDQPTDTPELDDSASVVDAEINKLPDTLRSAVLLCEIDGMSRAKAAERLGIAQGTLSSRLASARKMLRERLRHRGLGPLLIGVGAVAVPESLAKAAICRADGQALGAILELSQGVMRTMLLSKWKLTPLVVLGLVLGTGAALEAVAETPRVVGASPRIIVIEPHRTFVAAPVPQKPPEWKELFTLKQGEPVVAVAASGELIAVADASCRLRLWSARDGKESALPIRGAKFTKPANLLQFTVNDVFLVMSTPNTKIAGAVIRYERRAGGMVGDCSGIGPVAWSADLNTLVSWIPEHANQLDLHGNLWDGGNNLIKPFATVTVPQDVAITHATLSGNDRFLAFARDDSQIQIVDRKSLEVLHTIQIPKDLKLTDLKLSEDGSRLVLIGEAGFAKVLDTVTATELSVLKGHSGRLNAVAFTPDGTRVATANGKVVRVFDAKTGKPAGEINGHSEKVTAVAFTPDGKRLVTGSADKTAKVWEWKE